MKKLLIGLCLIVFISAESRAAERLTWKYTLSESLLTVSVTIPKGQYLYQKSTSAEVFQNGKVLPASETPRAVMHEDVFSGKTEIYPGAAVHAWKFKLEKGSFPLKLLLRWQGCAEASGGRSAMCFLPGSKEFTLEKPEIVSSPKTLFPEVFPEEGKVPEKEEGNAFPGFEIVRAEAGYIGASEFIAFLKGEKRESFLDFAGKNFLVILLLTLLGGIALNLTPCVLPMIPINLAIIGAKTGSRAACMFRGLIYGAGIAVAYGVVGVAVVLTGSSFGVIDSTWWFNALVALLFIGLGLSLFDLFLLDFSKYDSGFRPFSGARLIGIFAMGAVAAVLAGACVAPVVVAALLQSSRMYNSGEHIGLILPFVLGLGMALPWPIAAAGFSVMPKPGAWMKYVKYSFGAVILLIGIYYGYTAFRLGMSSSGAFENIAQNEAALKEALKESAKSGKPVLIDFRAEWCKSCKAMESTTFRNAEVQEELKNFIFIPFDATDITHPKISAVLERFEVSGLPAYRIVRGK
ncbi:MAG: Thiol:disulfide interchange protein DsbD precursor [Lentisphaerae bacterium ADurb.Bin242]|nr:MAG: Thiol:disulfide interchange protein DsbD precursor [Lentisphaerae bacterium ADurb.Bin242]